MFHIKGSAFNVKSSRKQIDMGDIESSKFQKKQLIKKRDTRDKNGFIRRVIVEVYKPVFSAVEVCINNLQSAHLELLINLC